MQGATEQGLGMQTMREEAMRRFFHSFRLMYWARRQEPRPDSRLAAIHNATGWALYERRNKAER